MSDDKPNRPKILVEKVHNMTGSTAGAGSGEFHNYSLHKQREKARLAAMDYQDRAEQRKVKFETKQKEFEDKAEQLTEKKRSQRQKKKQNKKNKKSLEQAQSLNQFANDGSFMDQFLKMKEQQEKQGGSDESDSGSDNENDAKQDQIEPNLQKKVKPNEAESQTTDEKNKDSKEAKDD